MITNRRLTGYKAAPGDRVRIARAVHDDDFDDIDDDDYFDDDEENDEDEHDDEEGEEEDSDDSMSVLSIPDPNIDFDLIYALHTFAATVEGQASVVKGDALTLLDDSNSYWWLIKVLKTAEIGYIPAENIETPFERLARLNSHRNIELTRQDPNYVSPPRPPASAEPPSTRKRVTLAKNVKFQAPVILGSSDDEDFEEEYEEWDEAMQSSESEESVRDMTTGDDDDYRFYVHQDDEDEENSQPPQSPDQLTEDTTSVKRNTFDFDHSDTIKISLTPSIARDADMDTLQPQQDPVAKLEQILNEGKEKEKGEKNSLRRLFSRNKDKTTASTSQGSETQSGDKLSSHPSAEDAQLSTIKVHVNGTESSDAYKEVQVHLNTTASDVISYLLGTTNRVAHDPADYHLTLRGVDGDEYTFIPTDKPLVIYRTLTAHLSTPMPSLKKARRISQLMSSPGGQQTHMGGPSYAPKVDEVCFYLHPKIRRSEEKERLVSIKGVVFASDVSKSADVFKPGQSRMDKCVEVAPHATVADVTLLLLDKFHILNGIVAGETKEDEKESRGSHRAEIDPVPYYLHVHRQGQEYALAPRDPIQNAFDNASPPTHQRRGGNPDRSSISLISSNTAPPCEEETYFVLRQAGTPVNTNRKTPPALDLHHKPLRYPAREPTPMPQRSPARPTYTPALNNSYLKQQQTPDRLYEATKTPDSIPTASSTDALLRTEETNGKLADPKAKQYTTEAVQVSPSTVHEFDRVNSDLLRKTPRPREEVAESMLFCNEQAMSELMVMIRGAARHEGDWEKQRRTSGMRHGEVSEVYKESQQTLERLEKELDRLMADAVRIYG